jgi:hypothetical protein
MRMARIRRASRSGGWRPFGACAGALTIAAVLGAVSPATAAASSQALDWTKQAPAASPPGRQGAAMAYDAANGTVVLFGGDGNKATLGGTWTWNGTTWTLQHPATSPPARENAAMAYDAATGTVVLFGGAGFGIYGDTWTWNGTTWTQQHPATSPSPRQVGQGGTMAYDAATGTVVLFGGFGRDNHALGDTWTWDGTTWTRQHPATHPPDRYVAAMAYDAATSTVVLFGGEGSRALFGDTWTWDGTTWTRQHPATSPPGRQDAEMAYDQATGTVVLFGGYNGRKRFLRDTWYWG